MNSTIDYIPPVSLALVATVVVALGIAFAVARLLAGPRAELARRSGLLVIRALVALLLLALLVNPVKVMESAGALQRGEVFYLLDSSASMGIGSEHTRWDDTLSFIGSAGEKASGAAVADVKLFRFGHRLSSLERLDGISPTASYAATLPLTTNVSLTDTPIFVPSDSDTRMQLALQQVISRFSRSPPGAVILFSDGRARDADGVEAIARHFAELKVPIHVVPAGDTSLGGDIAIVAAVVPPLVRKETEVEVQVFLRSYGYDGRRVEVLLSEVDSSSGLPARRLAPPQPVTLVSGIQPISLRFRADANTRNLMVSIPVQADEIAARNNSIKAEIDIDRTKIRVLYVEGSREPPRVARRGEELVTRGPYSELYDALTDDRDIECVVITTAYGDMRRVMADGTLNNQRGFPVTQAELLAYDALILSNVRRDYFSDEQLTWMRRWIGERGGGLCMVGGPEGFGSGGWDEGVMEEMLPVTIESVTDWDQATEIAAKVADDQREHPLWHLVSDAVQNEAILDTFPAFEGLNRGLAPKQSLSDVLATASVNQVAPGLRGGLFSLGVANTIQPTVPDSGEEKPAAKVPVVVVGRFGKGRTMAMPTAITAPWANSFLNDWGSGDNRYYAKYWRNAVYWLTESSSIGRRRLVADYDRRYYKPGDSILLRAQAYDESAAVTQNYRLVAMIEPQSPDFDFESIYSPVRWPVGIPRESGEDGPMIAWGEEFPLPKLSAETAGPLGASEKGFGIELQIADMLAGGSAGEGLRIELTAYEDYTQVDSTSLEIHVLHDPFEQKNPFPDHELLARVAELSGGKVLKDSGELAAILENQPVSIGPPEVRKSPLWSTWWLWSAIVGLLTVEWFWRRNIGLA